jgi:hypothetical protein
VPSGAGVGVFVPVAQTEACKAQSTDVATYLQRGEITAAAREGAIAASWLIKLGSTRAQIAFAGFDPDAKQVARARGVGAAKENAPRLFASGAGWTLVWFDNEGLVFTHPRWETSPAPVIEHLRAVSGADAEDVALAATPSGALVAVAPFQNKGDQLGLFLFAPADAAAPPVQALGATHHTSKPRHPAVAADASGYTLAWQDEDGHLAVSRFDLKGTESDDASTLAAKGPARERLAMAATSKGAIAVWSEGDLIVARAIDAGARPAATMWVVGHGRHPAIVSLGDGALVTWVGQDGAAAEQVLASKLGPDGAPSSKGVRVSDGNGAVKDAPALAAAGTRVAFLWTEPMGSGVSTKRGVLRTVDPACLP